MARLQAASPDLNTQRALLDEIAHLQSQLNHFNRVVRDFELEPGRGFVAAEGLSAGGRGRARARSEDQMDSLMRQAQAENGNFRNMVGQIQARPDLFPGGTLQKMLSHLPAQAADFNVFGYHLNRVLRTLDSVEKQGGEVTQLHKLIAGLASDNPSLRENANYLLRRISNGQEHGLINAEQILKHFSLDEIGQIRTAHQTAPFAAMGEKELFNALADVSARVRGGNASSMRQLIDLAGAGAGPGKPVPDVFRLRDILEGMGPGKHSADAIIEAVQTRNQLASELANAGNDLVRVLFRGLGIVPKAGEPINIGRLKQFRDGRRTSGSRVAAYFRDPARIEGITQAIVDTTGAVDRNRWLLLEMAIRNTDLDPSIKNNIIGHYFEEIRFRSLQQSAGSGKVISQLEIQVSGTRTVARIDNAVVQVNHNTRTVHIHLEEAKTGGAVLSDAQEIVEGIVRQNRGKANPSLDVRLPDEALSDLRIPDGYTIIIDDFVVARP
jgi:hypothetical protein